MKALFYGGALAGLLGLAMGMGMELPADPPPIGPDAQPVAQLFAPDASAETIGYGPAADALPPAYVINTAYSPGPAYDLRPELDAQPIADVYDAKAIDRVLDNAWRDPPEPAAAPQDVAAAGDTSHSEPAGQKTYASIDAVLTAAKEDQSPSAGPTL
jgi:hypothetical protein